MLGVTPHIYSITGIVAQYLTNAADNDCRCCFDLGFPLSAVEIFSFVSLLNFLFVLFIVFIFYSLIQSLQIYYLALYKYR